MTFTYWAVGAKEQRGWPVINDDFTEAYYFQTKEWAQLCCDHFRRLERINREHIITNVALPSGSVHFGGPPEPSEWKCELFGSAGGITLHPPKGKVPNWFWRKMQYLILGNRWVKNDVS